MRVNSAAQLYREVSKVRFDASRIVDLLKGDSSKFAWLVAGVVGPYLGTRLWWNTLYHPVRDRVYVAGHASLHVSVSPLSRVAHLAHVCTQIRISKLVILYWQTSRWQQSK